MTFPKEYFYYAAIAVVIGVVFSFGFIGMNHRPLPLQVQLDTYAPTTPPAPAIPTQAPQLVKDNTVKTGKFDPAPAPVVVTTAPLPTITPEATTAPEENSICPKYAGMVNNLSSALNIMGVSVLVLGLMTVMYVFIGMMSPFSGRGCYGGSGGGFSNLLTSGIMAIIIGGVFFMIGTALMNSLLAAQSGAFCPP